MDISELRGRCQGQAGFEQGQAPQGPRDCAGTPASGDGGEPALPPLPCGDQGGDFRGEMLVAESYFIFLTAGSSSGLFWNDPRSCLVSIDDQISEAREQ